MINLTYNLREDGGTMYHDFTVERDDKFVSGLIVPKKEKYLTSDALGEITKHLTEILNEQS